MVFVFFPALPPHINEKLCFSLHTTTPVIFIGNAVALAPRVKCLPSRPRSHASFTYLALVGQRLFLLAV